MSISKQLLPLTKKSGHIAGWYIERIVPFKPGQKEALERGINLRKHRECAELAWQAGRKGQAQSLYAAPSRDEIYDTAMEAIRQHQGQPMKVVLLKETEGTDLDSVRKLQRRAMYVIEFILEELHEKGWRSSRMEFEATGPHQGNVLLVSDFTQ